METLPIPDMSTLQRLYQPPQTSPLDIVSSSLGLTEQEKFLYQHHLNNLYGEGKVVQPNGDISTLLQAVVTGPDGKFYNIPTVWGGKALDPREATQRAAAVGWNKWPSYTDPKTADARYGLMHKYIDQDAMRFRKSQQ